MIGENIPRFGPAQRVLDRGRAYHGGPCAYAVECTADDRGIEHRGLHQRKERDPYRSAFYEAREELRRAGVLGTRHFVDTVGRDTETIRRYIHSRPRKKGPKARPAGDALD